MTLPAWFGRTWFGRPANLPADAEEARGELARLAERQPSLARHAHILSDAIPILFAKQDETPLLSLAAEYIAELWADGVPLLRGQVSRGEVLRGQGLAIDVPAFRRRWTDLCGVLSKHLGKDAPGALAQAVRDGGVDPQDMTDHVLAGHTDALHSRAESLGLDPGLAAMVLRWTLFPVLARIQASLAASLPASPWPKGYCPTCGSWPALGESRGLEQVRYLRCGWCAAAWGFPRLRCPYCAADDHRQLGYLQREGQEGKERVATCDACRGYVKTMATLTALTPVQLLVAEVATLPLDLVAGDRGYAVP